MKVARGIRKFLSNPFGWWSIGDSQAGLSQYVGNFGGTYANAPLSNPMQSSLIFAACRLIVDSISTVEFEVYPVGSDKPVEKHPMAELLRNPGGSLTRKEMLWLILDGLICRGNALLILNSDRTLQAIDWRNVTWPMPGMHRYQVRNPQASTWTTYDPTQVAHLRYRRSPDGYNGIGPLVQNVLDELVLDRQAQQYAITMLRNMGVPGIMLTPDDDADVFTQEDAEKIQRQLNQGFSGSQTGLAAVFGKKWKPHELSGANARRLDLRSLRYIPEERALAVLGVHPSMLGIGTGSENSRVGATVKELRREFVLDSVIPTAKLLAQQFTTHLLPFVSPPGKFEVLPDYQNTPGVEILRNEVTRQRLDYAIAAVAAGIWTPEQGREYIA